MIREVVWGERKKKARLARYHMKNGVSVYSQIYSLRKGKKRKRERGERRKKKKGLLITYAHLRFLPTCAHEWEPGKKERGGESSEKGGEKLRPETNHIASSRPMRER